MHTYFLMLKFDACLNCSQRESIEVENSETSVGARAIRAAVTSRLPGMNFSHSNFALEMRRSLKKDYLGEVVVVRIPLGVNKGAFVRRPLNVRSN